MRSLRLSAARPKCLAMIAAAAGLALAACGSNSGGAASPGTSANTVPIGMIDSYTGAYSAYGTQFAAGAQFAVSQINKTGFKVDGKTYKFSLTIVNDNSDPATAVQKATGLVADQHVVAVMGPLGTDGPGAEQVTNSSKVIMFSAAVVNAGPPSNNYTFLTLPATAQLVSSAVQAVKTFYPSATSVAFLGPQNQIDTADQPLFNADARAAGLAPSTYLYPEGSTDLSSILAKLVANHPSVVIQSNNSADRQLQAPQLVKAGLPKSTPLLYYAGTISECTSEAAGHPCIADPLAGVDLSASPLLPSAQQFVTGIKAFEHASALSPYSEALEWEYDFPFMLAQAMEKAGSVTDTTAIANSLHDVTRHGLLGTITFDKNNVAQFPLDMTLVSPAGKETSKSIGS
jgi:branched-chain amino acid transport system substrate-binding protein